MKWSKMWILKCIKCRYKTLHRLSRIIRKQTLEGSRFSAKIRTSSRQQASAREFPLSAVASVEA